MTKARRWMQRNALVAALLLTALASGLSVYAISQIQSQREASILRNCQDQNARHTNTVKQLDAVLKRAERQHVSAGRKAQIIASRGPTILLINALAPYQNCEQVLAKSTSSKP